MFPKLRLIASIILFCVISPGISQPVTKGYSQNEISDLVLIYQGGTQRLEWTKNQFKPYVMHDFRNGRKEWMFDGFLFLEFSNGKGRGYISRCESKSARKTEWNWLLDRVFEEGKSLSALDLCISDVKKELGNSDFQHKVVIGLPEPISEQKDWGKLSGKNLDFGNIDDRITACKWYIDELVRRFKEANYNNITLAGLYWVSEDVITSGTLISQIGDYIREKGYKFYWIPYWCATGYSQWKDYGFDMAYFQPNHFFDDNINDDRVGVTCDLATTYNMGLEIEFDSRVGSKENYSKLDRFKTYLDSYTSKGVFALSSNAYYEGGGAIYDLSTSKNDSDLYIVDKLAGIIVNGRMQRASLKKNPIFILDSTLWNTAIADYRCVANTRNLFEKQYGSFSYTMKVNNNQKLRSLKLRLLPADDTESSVSLVEYDANLKGKIRGGILSEKLGLNSDEVKNAVIDVSNFFDTYHTYRCDWTSRYIRLFVDGTLFFAIDNEFKGDDGYWPFNKPYYMELSVDGEDKQNCVILKDFNYNKICD